MPSRGIGLCRLLVSHSQRVMTTIGEASPRWTVENPGGLQVATYNHPSVILCALYLCFLCSSPFVVAHIVLLVQGRRLSFLRSLSVAGEGSGALTLLRAAATLALFTALPPLDTKTMEILPLRRRISKVQAKQCSSMSQCVVNSWTGLLNRSCSSGSVSRREISVNIVVLEMAAGHRQKSQRNGRVYEINRTRFCDRNDKTLQKVCLRLSDFADVVVVAVSLTIIAGDISPQLSSIPARCFAT